MNRRYFLKSIGVVALIGVASVGVANKLPEVHDEYHDVMQGIMEFNEEMRVRAARREAEIERLYNDFWAQRGDEVRARWLAQARYYEIEGREEWGASIAKTTHDFTLRRNGTFVPGWLSTAFTESRFSRCQACGMVGVRERDRQSVLHVISRWYYLQRGEWSSGYETFGRCKGNTVDA